MQQLTLHPIVWDELRKYYVKDNQLTYCENDENEEVIESNITYWNFKDIIIRVFDDLENRDTYVCNCVVCARAAKPT